MPLPSVSSPTLALQKPLDPIEALLASRGYGTAGGKNSPLTEEQRVVAKVDELKKAHVSLSRPVSGRSGASVKASKHSVQAHHSKAFASVTTARGAATSSSDQDAGLFSEAVERFTGCEAPWSHL